MKKLFFFFFVSIISFSSISKNHEHGSFSVLDSSKINSEKNSSKRINLFDSDDVLNVTLRFNITDFVRTRSKGEYHDAVLEIQENDGRTITEDIHIKARGNFRRSNCSFPPIRLNFKKDSSIIGVQLNKVKLVTHCMYAQKYENFILREYLAYKIYNMLSQYSFKVRLLNISYVDTGEKKKDFQRMAFIIEPVDFLINRYDAQELNLTMAGKNTVFAEEADQLALFEYMIGNTDWKIKGGHNVKFIKPFDKESGKAIAIPYDFDFSGFVGTPYSFPQAWTSIEKVSERQYFGYCRDDETYLNTISNFESKKDEILQFISSFEFMPEKEKKRLSKYIKEFYTIIEKPKRFIRILKEECRDDF